MTNGKVFIAFLPSKVRWIGNFFHEEMWNEPHSQNTGLNGREIPKLEES